MSNNYRGILILVVVLLLSVSLLIAYSCNSLVDNPTEEVTEEETTSVEYTQPEETTTVDDSPLPDTGGE